MAEGTIEEMRSRGGQALLIRATPLDQARRVVEAVLSPDRVSEHEGMLSLQVDPSQAASINRRLVADGVDVSELRMSEQSLEDVFLQLTEKIPSAPSPSGGEQGGSGSPSPSAGTGEGRGGGAL